MPYVQKQNLPAERGPASVPSPCSCMPAFVLTDDQILTISSLLDDIYPRGVFRELNLELRKMISKG